jgi:DNA replication protein DnaC
MEGMEKKLEELASQEADPAWQERMREKLKEREQEVRRVTGVAQREFLGKLDLPAKDLDLFKSDAFRRTAAVEALAKAAVLTVLSGGTGTGKTTAAAWWIYSWVNEPGNWGDVSEWGSAPKPRGSVVFVTAAKLARWARYNDDKMDAILRASRLVIDDLGAEFLDAKGAYASLLDEVINERYAHRRPTVLTTNANLDDFKARYGERIADRIREAGRFIALGKDSMRPRGGALPKQPALTLAPAVDPRLPPEADDDEPPRVFVPPGATP